MKMELQQRVAHNLAILRQNTKLSQSALSPQKFQFADPPIVNMNRESGFLT